MAPHRLQQWTNLHLCLWQVLKLKSMQTGKGGSRSDWITTEVCWRVGKVVAKLFVDCLP